MTVSILRGLALAATLALAPFAAAGDGGAAPASQSRGEATARAAYLEGVKLQDRGWPILGRRRAASS